MKIYYVYILSNNSKTLYIGVTNNIQRRIYEHKYKIVDGFTKKYNLTKLVYLEVTDSIDGAISREKELKNWKRQWKVELIENENPDWEDLVDGWFNEVEKKN